MDATPEPWPDEWFRSPDDEDGSYPSQMIYTPLAGIGVEQFDEDCHRLSDTFQEAILSWLVDQEEKGKDHRLAMVYKLLMDMSIGYWIACMGIESDEPGVDILAHNLAISCVFSCSETYKRWRNPEEGWYEE